MERIRGLRGTRGKTINVVPRLTCEKLLFPRIELEFNKSLKISTLLYPECVETELVSFRTDTLDLITNNVYIIQSNILGMIVADQNKTISFNEIVSVRDISRRYYGAIHLEGEVETDTVILEDDSYIHNGIEQIPSSFPYRRKMEQYVEITDLNDNIITLFSNGNKVYSGKQTGKFVFIFPEETIEANQTFNASKIFIEGNANVFVRYFCVVYTICERKK